MPIPKRRVTVSDIQDGSVTSNKIADHAVTEAKIAPGAVTETKIASGALQPQHLSPDLNTAISGMIDAAIVNHASTHSSGSTDPTHYIGQIILVGFNFAPRGWAACEGQILPISPNTALFSLLGTTYGGDGRTTFALPDLRSQAPSAGTRYVIALEGVFPPRS